MDVTTILAQIDAELTRLQQARNALIAINGGTVAVTGTTRRGRPKGSMNAPKPATKKRMMTPEGRARIAAAQKVRWAATKHAASKAAEQAATTKKASAKKTTTKKTEERSNETDP